MGFRSIRHYHYRNLRDAEIDVSAPQVFLVGDNGQGKSNFLESLYLVAFGSSFRTRRSGELIRRGEKEALVEAQYASEAERRRVTVRLGGRSTTIESDGKPVTDRKALVRNIPVIVFSHGDMEFVSGSPERRRWFFNQTQSLFDPLFIDLLRHYRRILLSRNAALKADRTGLLEPYDQQLAAVGLQIAARRRETVARFNETFEPVFREISASGVDLQVDYRPSWSAETVDRILSELASSKSRDLALQTTTTGPHRDDFRFLRQGRDFARLASTGQIRLLALILRVAQARHCTTRIGRAPVLLLDDVMLELDAARRGRFLSCLPDYEQAFFTFLPDERYLDYRRPGTIIYTVEDGGLLDGESR